MNGYAPIALFVYARPDHTRLTIEALQRNDLAKESDLIVYSDAAREAKNLESVNAVRTFVRSISGFRSVTIVERGQNMGLAASIIDGVTSIVQDRGAVIVVEDDLVVSPYFLRYMNDGLVMYEHDETVVSIHGYVYPVKGALPETFFIRGADCWGWATWKRGWDVFRSDGTALMKEITDKGLRREFDWGGHYGNIRMLKRQIAGKVDSWAIRWHASAFLQNKLTLYPGTSLVNNIGGDSLGTHTKSLDEFRADIAVTPVRIERLPLYEEPEVRRSFETFFRSIKRSPLEKILHRLKGILA